MNFLQALVLLLANYGLCGLLHHWLPARVVEGYACDRSGKVLVYRLNGVLVLLVVDLAYLGATLSGTVRPGLIESNYSTFVCAANVVGLVSAGVLYASVPPERVETRRRCLTKDRPTPRPVSERDADEWSKYSLPMRVYCGLEFNPRIWGTFDVKMWLYVVGAVQLHLNALDAGMLRYAANGWSFHGCCALNVYLLMLTWFVVEYLFWENVHLYTYDLFAEKTGGKLVWGCMVFYPFFYPIGVHSASDPLREELSASAAGAILALFFTGWCLTRGANLQKFCYKSDPGTRRFLMFEQQVIPGSQLLVSGFWGLSRHINYLGEVIQGLALALPGFLVTGSLLPFAYPAYYVALLVPRQIEDEKVCEEKYGPLWAKYKEQVPYRIVPLLY